MKAKPTGNRLDDAKKNTTLSFNEFPPVSTEEWEAIIERDLKGADYKETLLWNTGEGIDVLPVYRSEHIEKLTHIKAGIPHIVKDWEIKEYIKAENAEAANKIALSALENGANGLYFDVPSSALRNEDDISRLLKDILIDIIGIHFSPRSIDAQGFDALSNFIHNGSWDTGKLYLTVHFDPFEQAIKTGELASKESLGDVISNRLVSFGSGLTVQASGYGNMGATIVQQLALALATANEYLGSVDDEQLQKAAQNIHFNFSVGSNYFLEIAKFRAFRILWAQVLQAYGIEDSNTYVSAETALWNKSTMDANNNMLRATTEAMSAAIGNCDGIMVRPFDELYKEPNSFSQRIARNIQHILLEESYLNKVNDPSKGSYYLEILTDSLARQSWELFQHIEAKGGFHDSIRQGYIQELIIQSQGAAVKAIQDGSISMIGVNKHPQKDEDIPSAISVQQEFAFSPESAQNVTKVPTTRIAKVIEQGGIS